ncbi:MAG: nucleoside triphosphate pyrophosphohydrolase [Streptosporangiaceae bacterium]|jgi:hypothetical protein
MRVAHHKLVRDQIPEIIAAAGRQPVTRVLDQAGYQAALRAKLIEEAREADLPRIRRPSPVRSGRRVNGGQPYRARPALCLAAGATT